MPRHAPLRTLDATVATMDGDIDRFVERHSERYLQMFEALVRIPSVSTDPAFADHVASAAAACAVVCEGVGLCSQVYATSGHPVVVARGPEVEGAPRVLVYGHYDVQPADPVDAWDGDPFEPRRVDGAVVGRGTNDDKGQFLAHVAAADVLRSLDGALPVNLTMLLEGEEEIGSPNLPAFLEAHRESLACDTILVSDGTLADPGVPGLTYGIRGSCTLQVEVRTATAELHSGNVGGAVPNAVSVLSALIAGLHDASRRVAVEGFYDAVVDDAAERARVAEVPFDEDTFKATYGVTALAGEAGRSSLERMWLRPTLEPLGVAGGYAGPGVKTVIPACARAVLGARIVPNQTAEGVIDAVRAHLERHAPAGAVVRVSGGGGAEPARMDPGGAAFQVAAAASEDVWGVPARYVRGGGSIGIIATFQRVFGVDPVLLGFGDKDDRIHAPNERFRIANYLAGIRTSARFLRRYARHTV